MVVPIDLVAQQARRPIKIPGQGGTHAIVVLPGGRTILAASGSTVVPVDAVTHDVGAHRSTSGPGHTIFGMALSPDRPHALYTLVAGGVFPVDTASGAPPVERVPTGLSASSVYSPTGIAVTGGWQDHRLYVVGQAGVGAGREPTSAGGVLPIVAATGATLPMTGFDRFGIADPASPGRRLRRRHHTAGGRLGQQLGQ